MTNVLATAEIAGGVVGIVIAATATAPVSVPVLIGVGIAGAAISSGVLTLAIDYVLTHR